MKKTKKTNSHQIKIKIKVTGSSSPIGQRVLKTNSCRDERSSESLCPAAQRDESSTTTVPLVYKDVVKWMISKHEDGLYLPLHESIPHSPK